MMLRSVFLVCAVAAVAVNGQTNRADPCVVAPNQPYTDLCGVQRTSNSQGASLYKEYEFWNQQPFTSSASFGYFSDHKMVAPNLSNATSELSASTMPLSCPTGQFDFLPQSPNKYSELKTAADMADYVAKDFAANWTVPDAAKFLGYTFGEFGPGNDPPFCLTVEGTLNRKVQIIVETDAPDAKVCVRNNNQQTSSGDPSSVEQCGSGQFKACFMADYDARCNSVNCPGANCECNLVPQAKKNMNLYFYCKENCNEQSETAFYFKAQVSSSPYTYGEYNAMSDGLEMWCSIINNGLQFAGDCESGDEECEARARNQQGLTSLYPSDLIAAANPDPEFQLEMAEMRKENGATSHSVSSSWFLLLAAMIATTLWH